MSSTAAKCLRMIVSTAFAIVSTGTALAATTNGEAAVVAKLYKDFAWQALASQHDLFGDDVAHQGKATLEHYFSPALADLLVNDAACQIRSRGICNLDFDLLFDSQDPRVMDLDVTTTSPGRVAVIYKDPVDGKATRMEFDVARVAGQWKIADIIYSRPDRVSLKRVLSRHLP